MSLCRGQVQWRFTVTGTRVDVNVTALMKKKPRFLQIPPFRGTQEFSVRIGAPTIFYQKYVGYHVCVGILHILQTGLGRIEIQVQSNQTRRKLLALYQGWLEIQFGSLPQ